MIHELKAWPEFYQEIFLGHKNFEVRKSDRDFKVGDTLTLREWNPQSQDYTGNMLSRSISYILKGGQFGVQEGYVVMSIQ